MDNISGIIVREHIEQKYIKKFPKIIPWMLLVIAGGTIFVYYAAILQLLHVEMSIGTSILMLGGGFLCGIASLCTMPSRYPEEFLIEVTPRMSAIDWLVVEQDFEIQKEGLLLYRCRRKGWKV